MINNLPAFQILAIIGSVLIVLFLIELIRKRKLKESYSLLWFGIALVFLLFSLKRDLLTYVAFLLGVNYVPAALFLILIIGSYLLLIHFSVVISELSEKNKNLSQEVGLLDLEIKELKKINKNQRKK